jgi:hypothetical protein
VGELTLDLLQPTLHLLAELEQLLDISHTHICFGTPRTGFPQ